MVHVGVDLHKRTSQIAVLTEHGELTRHRLVNDVERVKEFFAELPPKTPVAIEASGTWWWLVELVLRQNVSRLGLRTRDIRSRLGEH